jgi:hypothetical protein
MTSINLDQSYKTTCKYCGLVKKSLVPGNFVCGSCKKFCEQQLSGAELIERDDEVAKLIGYNCLKIHDSESKFILKAFKAAHSPVMSISNQQYLSVIRILKGKKK